MKPLLHHPPRLLRLPLPAPIIPRREPLRPRRVLLRLVREPQHARVHRPPLRPAHKGRGERAVRGAGRKVAHRVGALVAHARVIDFAAVGVLVCWVFSGRNGRENGRTLALLGWRRVGSGGRVRLEGGSWCWSLLPLWPCVLRSASSHA